MTAIATLSSRSFGALVLALRRLAAAHGCGRRLSRQADPPDRSAGARQRHRRAWRGCSAPSSARSSASTIVVDNRPGGALTHRPRPDREVGARRLHASAWDRSARSPSPATWWRSCRTTSSATSSRSRWSARGHLLLAVSTALPVDVGEGADRARQAEPRQADQRLVEQRLARPCRRRIVQVHDRHQHPARALQGRRAGDHRPDRRPRAAHVRDPDSSRSMRTSRAGARRSA